MLDLTPKFGSEEYEEKKMNVDSVAKLVEALRGEKVEVEQLANTLNAVRGMGPFAHHVNLDLDAFENALNSRMASSRDATIQAFARGVATVMTEPARSPAKSWDFARSASRMAPNLVTSAFLEGAVAATGGDPAFSVPYHDDVHLIVVLHIDRGLRLLTRGQVDAWGATNDRVVAAARSLLFHHTRDARWESIADTPVQRLIGMDQNAVRSLVFADVFYSDVGPKIRFGIPTEDEFFFVADDTPENVQALKSAVESASRESLHRLTTAIFGFESGHPIAVEH
jgi:hypothetical protein